MLSEMIGDKRNDFLQKRCFAYMILSVIADFQHTFHCSVQDFNESPNDMSPISDELPNTHSNIYQQNLPVNLWMNEIFILSIEYENVNHLSIDKIIATIVRNG